MCGKSVHTLGLWSSILSSFFSIALTTAGILDMLGILSKHWANLIVYSFSLLLAICFLIMMVTIHYVAEDDRELWSHLGIAFSVLYTTMATMVYIVMLFVVEPNVIKGQVDSIKPFIFDQGTFNQIVDGLGYTFKSIATLFAAFVFKGDMNGALVYRFFIANGITAVPVFISYITYNILIGLPWVITMPGSAIVLAVYFSKQQISYDEHKVEKFYKPNNFN